MKIFLSLIFTGLLFVSLGFAVDQTDQGTSEQGVTTTKTTTMSHTHMKSDECTAAKVRTKLMDNGIQSKSSKGSMTTTTTGTYNSGTTTPMELIEVDVENGVVTLTGTVPSAADTQRILTIVRGTDGVTRVVSNLKPGSTGGADMTPGDTTSDTTESTTSSTTTGTSTTTESPMTGTTDAALTAAVKSKLSTEGSTLPPVDVVTEDGVVTLTGTVANQGEAERLIMLVRAIPNVKSVNSQLKVRP